MCGGGGYGWLAWEFSPRMRLWAGDGRHFRLGVMGTLSGIVKFTLYWDSPFSLC